MVHFWLYHKNLCCSLRISSHGELKIATNSSMWKSHAFPKKMIYRWWGSTSMPMWAVPIENLLWSPALLAGINQWGSNGVSIHPQKASHVWDLKTSSFKKIDALVSWLPWVTPTNFPRLQKHHLNRGRKPSCLCLCFKQIRCLLRSLVWK